MATSPAFANIPNIGIGNVATANTNRDGTGTVATLFTAGSNGSRIERIVVTATSTTSAGVIRLFIYNGSNYFLWREIAVSAVTPSGTVKTFQTEIVSPAAGLPLLAVPAGYSIRASTHNAESFNLAVEGANF